MIPIVALLILLFAFLLYKGMKCKSTGLILTGGIPLLLAALGASAALAYAKLEIFDIHRLECAYNSQSSQERKQAIQVLSTQTPEAACLPVILNALQDADRGVRHAALNYLRLRYGDSVPIPDGVRLSNGYNWSSEFETGMIDPFDVWLDSWQAWIHTRINKQG